MVIINVHQGGRLEYQIQDKRESFYLIYIVCEDIMPRGDAMYWVAIGWAAMPTLHTKLSAVVNCLTLSYIYLRFNLVIGFSFIGKSCSSCPCQAMKNH